MNLIIAAAVVFVLLVGCELWWRTRNLHTEFSRKFIHITVGSFVAFWPFFLSWNQIRLLGVAFLVVVAVSKYLGFFKAIHSVQRPTWGEVFFALAVGAVTFVTHDKYIYMAALLQMSLADGMAAVVGVRYGRSQTYKVLGHIKSLAGSATFYVISVCILIAYMHFAGHYIPAPKLVGLSLVATVLENFGVAGLDNLLVPVVVAFGLTLL